MDPKNSKMQDRSLYIHHLLLIDLIINGTQNLKIQDSTCIQIQNTIGWKELDRKNSYSKLKSKKKLNL